MLAVVDATPGSGERNFPNTILFGSLLVVAELHDLSVPKAKAQDHIVILGSG